MFKKNDTLRNVLLAGLACLALIFAGCNQAVDDGGNYVELNDGQNVTVAHAADAIRNQQGGTIYVKIGPTPENKLGSKAGDATILAAAIRESSAMVELDLSEAWNNADEGAGAAGAADLFGGVVDLAVPKTDPNFVPGSRRITTIGSSGTDFAGLKNLAMISLPFTVGSIADNAFTSCENLETVKINFFFTSDVDKTNLYATEYMYDDKFLLASIGKSAFANCKALRTFILVSDPDNDDVDEGFPVSLTSIGDNAFENCYSLEGVRFFNTRNMGTDFQHEVDGVDFVAHPVAYPKAEAEADRTALYWVDAEGVGRNGLSKYSSGISTADAYITGQPGAYDLYIGKNAFANCKALEYVDFTNKNAVGTADAFPVTPTNNLASSTVASGAFSGCESLTAIYYNFGDGTPAIAPRYTSYELGTETPGTGNLPANVKFGHITVFGDYSFQFTAIGNDTLHDLFHLTDYVERGGNQPGAGAEADEVKAIGKRAFFGCQNISEVLLPSTITDDMAYDGVAATGLGTKGLGDGAFANTSVEYIWVHENNKVFSILEEWKNADGKVAPYWTGALIDKDPTAEAVADMPTIIYAWYVTPFSGDLTYLPRLDSQNPRTKVLGSALADIRGDAFYNNVDVEKILFPATINGTTATTGIGNYAFANAENLTDVYTELKAVDADAGKGWSAAVTAWEGATPASYYGSFVNTPATVIHASDVDSGLISK